MKRFLFSTFTTFTLSAGLFAVEETTPADSAVANTQPLELEAFFAQTPRIAVEEPAGTYAMPVTLLRFEPRVDVQGRNGAEAQGDVTIRGGIFENTGFQLGAVTLFDPQTGHYFAEIPVPTAMLGVPQVYTGVENALHGFNSGVGTIAYDFAPLRERTEVTAFVGEDDLNRQSVLGAAQAAWQGGTLGAEIEASRSEGDGTLPGGDHDFERVAGRVEYVKGNARTTLFAGYQAKYFQWPNLYTPFGVLESENLQTVLVAADHDLTYGEGSSVQLTGVYRRHRDEYTIPAFSFAANHTTSVRALGAQGRHRLDDNWAVRYGAQYTSDTIRSSSLTFPVGSAAGSPATSSRQYGKATLLPEYTFTDGSGRIWTARAGVSYDAAETPESADPAAVRPEGDRDFSPLAELAVQFNRTGGSDRYSVQYAEATQVPGYTAVAGSTSGLFASNPTLGRESSRGFEVGGQHRREGWALQWALYYRQDDDLVDWVFLDGQPSTARWAEDVDIDTYGLEAVFYWQPREDFEAVVGYTFLDKDEDYGALDNPFAPAGATIVDSYYARNYAEHRLTVSLSWRPIEQLLLRVDTEARKQAENALRASGDEAILTAATVSWQPPRVEGLEVVVAVENLFDEDFEEVPAVPASGRQFSLGLVWRR